MKINKEIKPRTPKIYDSLKDPMVAAAFLVFGLVVLLLSVINYIQALNY